jgi:hypothetical protein
MREVTSIQATTKLLKDRLGFNLTSPEILAGPMPRAVGWCENVGCEFCHRIDRSSFLMSSRSSAWQRGEAGSFSLMVSTSTSTAETTALLARSLLSSASESRSRRVYSMTATVLTAANAIRVLAWWMPVNDLVTIFFSLAVFSVKESPSTVHHWQQKVKINPGFSLIFIGFLPGFR